MRLFLFQVSALFVILVSSAGAEDALALFRAANEAYDSGDFETARRSYASIVEDEGVAADLFYNLGNTAYRLDKAGEAALWYQRALVLDPSHAESRQNLRVLEREYGFLTAERTFVEMLAGYFTQRQITLVCLAGFWGFAITIAFSFAFKRHRHRPAVAGIRAACAALFILAVTALFMRRDDRLLLDRSIVTTDDSLAVSSPADDGKDVISLPPGTEVDLLAQRAAWSYVGIPGELRGWVRSEELTPLWPFDTSFLE